MERASQNAYETPEMLMPKKELVYSEQGNWQHGQAINFNNKKRTMPLNVTSTGGNDGAGKTGNKQDMKSSDPETEIKERQKSSDDPEPVYEEIDDYLE